MTINQGEAKNGVGEREIQLKSRTTVSVENNSSRREEDERAMIAPKRFQKIPVARRDDFFRQPTAKNWHGIKGGKNET